MTTKKAAGIYGLLFAALLVSACSSPGPSGTMAERDPYESTNRFFHERNLSLDKYVLRPAAKGYNFITPELIQHLFGNAVNQLDTVSDFANYVFQGDVDAALVALGRFTVNAVLGAGGLLDPATEFGLPKEDTDFGVTMGKYGVGEGAYLVLPLLGPSTTRDTVGAGVEYGLDGLTYVGIFAGASYLDYALPAWTVTEIVDRRNRNADLIDDLLYESADSYVSIRSIYLQRRDSLIRGGETDDDSLPDIFDTDTSN
ncbi:VacJ family lipoprotein [Rhodobacteraceae bacterium NNCM2]|nr:VacJ family lipoprotein [Coraliihabitans acroporae]